MGFFGITKSFDGRAVIKPFSLRIQRGDRIGIVGANGAGKTTLLKMLTGELEPDTGTVTISKKLTGVMIDQQRTLMEPDRTVRQVLAEGGDWLDVRGNRKHVQAYLKDFLFDPKIVETKVGILSGSEQIDLPIQVFAAGSLRFQTGALQATQAIVFIFATIEK